MKFMLVSIVGSLSASHVNHGLFHTPVVRRRFFLLVMIIKRKKAHCDEIKPFVAASTACGIRECSKEEVRDALFCPFTLMKREVGNRCSAFKNG